VSKTILKSEKFAEISTTEIEQRANVVYNEANAIRRNVLAEIEKMEKKYIEWAELIKELNDRTDASKDDQTGVFETP